ncbi:MAG: hypothetical protein DLM73_01190 [Chthoniobacterales bacterium]|nr:MAG: hypothetical protein DLM73_01190 [Chthoniobacterales bacterium]
MYFPDWIGSFSPDKISERTLRVRRALDQQPAERAEATVRRSGTPNGQESAGGACSSRENSRRGLTS